MEKFITNIFNNKIKKNIENFNINSASVQAKINTFCKKYNFNKKDIINKINANDLIKYFFIPNPLHQNIYEQNFYNLLKSIPGIKKIKWLPHNGNKSIYIINQTIYNKKTILSNYDKSLAKSMDFTFKYKNLSIDFYVFQKNTNGQGGAQDNQKNDVINSIRIVNLNNHINNKIIILYICDGTYYAIPRIYLQLKTLCKKHSNIWFLNSGNLLKTLELIYKKRENNNV